MKTLNFQGRISLVLSLAAAILVALSVAGHSLRAQPASAIGTICARPGAGCDTSYKQFAPYELPFRLPKTLKVNAPFRSESFYAVVLYQRASGRDSDCDGGEWTASLERERRRIQRLFPTQKVFADHQCPDMSAVNYLKEGKPGTDVFIAVCAGQNRESALAMVRRTRKTFRSARLQRMNVIVERIVQ